MFNPVDTSQIRAMVDHRREQVATDAARVRQAISQSTSEVRRWQNVRFAVGIGVMRVGARIAGVYASESPRLRPGV